MYFLIAEDISTTVNNGAAANILATDQKKTRKSLTQKNGGQSRPRQTAPRTKLKKKNEDKALSNDNQTA